MQDKVRLLVVEHAPVEDGIYAFAIVTVMDSRVAIEAVYLLVRGTGDKSNLDTVHRVGFRLGLDSRRCTKKAQKK
jgi:hypothetical protein